MLKLKSPIKLKTLETIRPGYEAFAQRIIGNYELMQTSFTGEDLLHVVTEPPEIFLAEGSVSTMVQQVNIRNLQENKLEILNQLMNRITVQPDIHMTYQDRVYITDVLQKLGIRNTTEFMQSLRQLKEETANTTELIRNYSVHMEQLRVLVNQYKTNEKHLSENSEETYRQELYLHEEIQNRLHTQELYETIMNFRHNQMTGAFYISNNELKNAEYYRIVRNMKLHRLENEAKSESIPLSYRNENYYEESFPYTEEVTEEKITNRIAAAVLLQLADNIYQNRYEGHYQHSQVWYEVSRSLFLVSENTMNRMHYHLLAQYQRTTKKGDYLVRHNENLRQEMTLLEKIFEDRQGQEVSAQLWLDQSHTESLDSHSHFTQETVNNRYGTENRRTENTYRTEADNTLTQQKITLTGAPVQEPVMDHVRDVTGETTPDAQEVRTDVTIEQLKEFHRHNLENRNKYQQVLLQFQQRSETPKVSIDRKKMQKDGLRALEHPEEMILELQQERRTREEEQAQFHSQQMELLPEDTRRIYEAVEKYLTSSAGVRQAEAETSRNISSLMRDITEVEQHTREQKLVHTSTNYENGSVTGQVIERWQENPRRDTRVVVNTVGKEPEQLELTHRIQTGQTVDEKLIEELLHSNRSIEKRTKQLEDITQETRTMERHTTQQTTREIISQTENLTEMIQQGVQGRIGEITDQVYSRLERRLQNERRRRGY